MPLLICCEPIYVSAVFTLRFIVFCHYYFPPDGIYLPGSPDTLQNPVFLFHTSSLKVLHIDYYPKNRGEYSSKYVAFFTKLYYNHSCKKNLPFKNFFYITPYLIIYTPLEIPGSSPIGYFSV